MKMFLEKRFKFDAEGEIRTPVARGATGFQDRRRGPLGYLSISEKIDCFWLSGTTCRSPCDSGKRIQRNGLLYIKFAKRKDSSLL